MNSGNGERKDDLDRALDDSFPASDPPSMTAGTTATPSEPHTAAVDDQHARHVRIYRVVEPPDAEAPFGAQPTYRAGRWSSQGTAVVYASANEAAAILEYLAHADGGDPDELLMATATLPADCVLAQAALPSTWAEYPYPAQTQCIGDQWVSEHKSLALRLPSALAPNQYNYLINPAHVDKVHMQSIATHPVRIDRRLRS